MALFDSRIGDRLTILLLAAACYLVTTHVQASESSYIFEIPAQRGAESEQPLGEYIVATLDYANPRRAAEEIITSGALDVIEITDSGVIVGIRRDAITTAVVEESDVAASFVVDYDEDPVVSSARMLRDIYGEQPSPEEMAEFVFDYIDDKNYAGSFDFASKVAQTRSGDCTEHAVLLTALARTHGLPARLVMGVVLLESEYDIDAYGHAWTEIFFDNTWQRLDATAPTTMEGIESAYYLPLLTLEDEGPGYGMDFMRLMQVQPARISDIRGLKP